LATPGYLTPETDGTDGTDGAGSILSSTRPVSRSGIQWPTHRRKAAARKALKNKQRKTGGDNN
jgi:hypothetical protein